MRDEIFFNFGVYILVFFYIYINWVEENYGVNGIGN